MSRKMMGAAMATTPVNPQNITNLEITSQAAVSDQRPLLLLHSDFERMLGYTQKSVSMSFPAPLLPPDDLNELWPNGYREVDRFLVTQAHTQPRDTLSYALSFQEFLRVGLDLTLQKGPLFWTVLGKNEFHLIISALERIHQGAVNVLQENLAGFQPQNHIPIGIEDLNEL
jgi:hypothetical protein